MKKLIFMLCLLAVLFTGLAYGHWEASKTCEIVNFEEYAEAVDTNSDINTVAMIAKRWLGDYNCIYEFAYDGIPIVVPKGFVCINIERYRDCEFTQFMYSTSCCITAEELYAWFVGDGCVTNWAWHCLRDCDIGCKESPAKVVFIRNKDDCDACPIQE